MPSFEDMFRPINPMPTNYCYSRLLCAAFVATTYSPLINHPLSNKKEKSLGSFLFFIAAPTELTIA